MVGALFRSIFRELTIAFRPNEWSAATKKLKHTRGKQYIAILLSMIPCLLIYYIILSPAIAAPMYNLMLFHPTMTGPYYAHQIVGTKIENVSFKSKNGTKLHGWFLPCADAKSVVLISHGNGGNLTFRIPLIAMFLRSKQSVFIYDYEGYGKSEGSPTVENICADGEAAFDWLISEKGFRAENVVVFGESLGCGVACKLAQRHPIKGIILQSAYTSLTDLAQEKLFWLRLYPQSYLDKFQLDNVSVLQGKHAPLLLVHGTCDRLISVEHSRRLFKSAALPKSFIELPDAGHNDIFEMSQERYYHAVGQFLQGNDASQEK
ncbi:MAG: alpha/beta hydrolase [Cyanobacteria bacterium]|nr:alpha/beta hydrolase [Cyanobacteriota bacterium]